MSVMEAFRLDTLVLGLSKSAASLVITGLYSLPKLIILVLLIAILYSMIQMFRRK